jgi:hypothetical protein
VNTDTKRPDPATAAAHAWGLMIDWALPARTAVQHVIDCGTDHRGAVEQLLVAAVTYLANVRPGDFTTAPTVTAVASFHLIAGELSGHILRGDFDAAKQRRDRIAQIVAGRQTAGEFQEGLDKWLDWCREAARVIALARQIAAAGTYPLNPNPDGAK